MTVVQLDDYRKTKKVSFSELCDIFIEKADPIISAQMETTHEGRWRMLSGDVFLQAAGGVAGLLSKCDIQQKCKERRADRMAGFILRGEYAESVFALMLDGQYRTSAGEARAKGLDHLAKALEADPFAEITINHENI